jgi:hypothetical protein
MEVCMNRRRVVFVKVLITAVCCLALFAALSGCDPSGDVLLKVYDDQNNSIGDGKDFGFGDCECGASVVKSFELTNEGNKAVEIREISLTNSEGSEFELTTDYQGSLGTGSTGSFDVTFAPTAAGDYSANVSIEIADTENDFNFTVTGSGTGSGGSITLSPPGWTIGDWAASPSGNTYSFTSDDVIVNGDSFKAHNEANAEHPESCYTEGEKSDILYVINVPPSYSYEFRNTEESSNPSTIEVTIITFDSVTETAARQ